MKVGKGGFGVVKKVKIPNHSQDFALKIIQPEEYQTNEEFDLNVKACFIAIGQSPKTDIFEELTDRVKGYILVDEDMMTKTDGLYAIGDVRSKKVRQLTTAVSDAAIAAFNITKRLS